MHEELNADVTSNRPRWPWMQFGIAVGMIPLGGVCWYVGLGLGLGVGSSGSTQDDWFYPIAEALFIGGPFLAGAGVLWLITLLLWAVPCSKNSAIGWVVAQILMALVVLFVQFTYQPGAISWRQILLITAPALAFTGYAATRATWPMLSWLALAFGLSGPLVSVAEFLLFLSMRRAAFGYLMAMLIIYLVAAVAAGYFVIRKARDFVPPIDSPTVSTRQYGLKTLFVAVAMLALFLAVLRSLVRWADGHEVVLSMAIYVLVNMMTCGIVIGRFSLERRRN